MKKKRLIRKKWKKAHPEEIWWLEAAKLVWRLNNVYFNRIHVIMQHHSVIMHSPFCFVLHKSFFGEFQICQAAAAGGGECVWWEWRHDFAWIVDGIGKSHRSSQRKGIFSTQTYIGRLPNYRNQHWHFCWKPAPPDHRPGKGTIQRHVPT